jgi:hypothetical protein
MTGEFRGKQLFAGRLFAGRLFGPHADLAVEVDEQSVFGEHRRRSWRPPPIEQLQPPIKRSRKRRQADIIFLVR